MTLSPERYAGLLLLEDSPDPPTSRLRPRPDEQKSTLEICLSLQQHTLVDSSSLSALSTADVFDSDQHIVLQTPRDASWQDPLTRIGLSVTPRDEQPEALTALQDQQWPSHAKRNFSSIPCRCGTCTNCGPTRAIWVADDSNDTC